MSQHNGIAIRQQGALLPDAATWGTMIQMAEALFNSGLLPASIKSPQAAVAVIQKGTELGIPPMAALSSIVVIQGKPTANAELMLALIYRDHGDSAIVFTHSDNTQCEVAYKRRSWPSARTYTFTMADAKQASLLGNQTWQKYPAAMLRARCISAVARMAFPDSIGGMHTPDELGAEVDVIDGEVVVIEQRARENAHKPVYDALPDVDTETGEIVEQPVRGIVDVLSDEIEADDTDSFFDTDGTLLAPPVTGEPAHDIPVMLDLLQEAHTPKRYRQARDYITQIGLHVDPAIAGIMEDRDAKIAARRRSAVTA